MKMAFKERIQKVFEKMFPKETRMVKKLPYCILAFALGGLGVHKFYAGKIGMGIVYLLFSWTSIPRIISFFEFISAAIRMSDEKKRIAV